MTNIKEIIERREQIKEAIKDAIWFTELKPIEVWLVEFKKYGDDYEFKIFKTEAEAEQFADEFRIGCMWEDEIAEMKAKNLNSEEYCFNELIAVAIVSKHIA